MSDGNNTGAPPPGLDAFLAEEGQPTPQAEAQGAIPAQMQAPVSDAPPGLDEFIAPEMQQEKYGTTGQQAIAGLEGVARGVAGPLAPAAERALGVNPEDIRGREEANPATQVTGEVAGLVGSSLLGVGLGGALAKVGAAAKVGAEAAGIGKIGSSIATAAIENIAFQAQEEGSKLVLGDPNQSVHTAVADMGLAAVVGGAFGTIPPLWNATMGKKLGGLLGAAADKMGGIEGITNDTIEKKINESGIQMAPELKGLIASDPAIQQSARELVQSPSNSGVEYQKKIVDFHAKVSEAMANALGKSAEEISGAAPLSKYERGAEAADSLANHYEEAGAPFKEGYEEIAKTYGKAELNPNIGSKGPEIDAELNKINKKLNTISNKAKRAVKAGNVEESVSHAAEIEELQQKARMLEMQKQSPGTTDKMLEKINQQAIKEGWTTSPSSDKMKLLARVNRELPLQKTVKNLSDFIQEIKEAGRSMSTPTDNTMTRVGDMLGNMMTDGKNAVLEQLLGEKGGAAAIEHFNALKEGYAVQASLKDAIRDRLGVKGSITNFANSIREMGRTDAEGVLRRLSGKGDADWLKLMQKVYPETAKVIRQFHVDELLQSASTKAKEGFVLDSGTLIKKLEGMSPELKEFIAPPEALGKIKALNDILRAFKDPNYGHSNSARVIQSFLKEVQGTAVGMAATLAGKGIVKSTMLGMLSKALVQDAPDAIKLAMLKWLGSSKEISPSGFKTMVSFIQHTMRGENATAKAINNVFKGGVEVLPQHMLPTDRDRTKINKAIDSAIKNPESLLAVSGDVGHYMPNHAEAMGTTAANAVQLLRTMRPNTAPANPMDSKREPSAFEKAKYNRAVDIAQQPLLVLKHIAEGTITPDDVNVMKALYPGLVNRVSQKLMNGVVEAKEKGKIVPYKTRMGISLFLGQAMDSTMTPAGIQGAQPKPQQNQQQTPVQPASNPKRSTNSLNKLPAMYQTTGQNAERDRSTRK